MTVELTWCIKRTISAKNAMTVHIAFNVNFCKGMYGYPTGDSIVTKTRKPGFVYVEHHA